MTEFDDTDRILGALQAQSEAASDQLAEIFHQLREMRTTQDTLAGCLPGLKRMTEDHEKRLRVQEAEASKRIGRAGVIGAIAGLVTSALAALAAWANKII